jgi:hypothetical protein
MCQITYKGDQALSNTMKNMNHTLIKYRIYPIQETNLKQEALFT